MKCNVVKQELSAYLNKELTPRQEFLVEAHLTHCGTCAREMVRLRQIEQRLREDLEKWAQQGQEGLSLTAAVQEKAAGLSAGDIEAKKQLVFDALGGEKERGCRAAVSQQPQARRKGVSHHFTGLAAGLVAGLLVLFLSVSFWPEMVRASSKLPMVGPWVRELVLRDAGLSWAYENDYIERQQISVSREGVTLTILGTAADPVQTTVIYLLEGWSDPLPEAGTVDDSRSISEDLDDTPPGSSSIPPLAIEAINGEGVGSWQLSGVETPLGYLGYVQTNPLEEGEHVLTVTLEEEAGLSVELTVSRDVVSRLSESYPLDYEKTVAGITLRAERVVYTPTQVMVEYTISGGGTLEGLSRPEYNAHLLAARGEKLSYQRGITGEEGSEGSQKVRHIFNRSTSLQASRVVIPALGRYEELSAEFTPQDIKQSISFYGHQVELLEWRQQSGQLMLTLGLPAGGPTQAFKEWAVTLADGTVQEAPVNMTRLSFDESSGLYEASYYLEHDPDTLPVSAAAKQVQRIIVGNWVIELPGPAK